MDLGPCTQAWTPQYIASLPSAQSTQVSVHVTRERSGCLDFTRKNYEFKVMSLQELILRASGDSPAGTHSLPPLLVPNDVTGHGQERYYLRSLGANPRKEPSDLQAAFPELAAQVKPLMCLLACRHAEPGQAC